ncbi:hypothetical protein N7495_005027 [Penicillium taxi]|uniref:uncharacterized protein n=1 Tax=Penicillium taxi TaxID=168475 RepID=UPI002544F747|nr:uncharacterized protein N7495_005027 [Penicillium taxi]KAJ5893336.1 hypothetical protein N7495_005027 [Penicillium taxi]
MANFQHPFQRLQYVKRQSQDLSDVLVASAGLYLYSYAAADGQRLDVWPQHVAESTTAAASSSEGQSPPEKRRKLSTEFEGNKEKDTSNYKPTWSNIPLMVASSDGKYVVILTAEDKSIRVLELKNDGKLQELSSRTMPKRPSALALTPDNQTILVGDKFGDGYSMPLTPGEYVKTSSEKKLQAPAATNLTVHTKRNLESLEQQKREQQKRESATGEPAKEKTSLDFEHQVVLGHMSVLTDLISVSLSGRNYVLTADRDEHIRVSRGIPQVHIIEQYCLGHTSLISKLCIPSWAPNVLISGDADGQLFLWNWTEGQVLQQISLQDILQTPDIMVRGIQDVVLGTTDPVRIIVVSLEGSSQIVCFTIEGNALKFQDTVQLSGNSLDVVGADASGSVIVSVDAVREAGSTNTWRSSPNTTQALLQTFEARPGQNGLQFILLESPVASSINSSGTSDLSASLEAKKRKEIDDSMYTLGNLKKKKWDE